MVTEFLITENLFMLPKIGSVAICVLVKLKLKNNPFIYKIEELEGT